MKPREKIGLLDQHWDREQGKSKSLRNIYLIVPGGGGFFKKICTGMLYTSKSVILWPISIPFFCKKHPIWDKLGAFLAKFSKIHPILQIGRIGYVTITHPSIYQNLRKCTSKPLSIHVYHLSVRTPPPPRWSCPNNFTPDCTLVTNCNANT